MSAFFLDASHVARLVLVDVALGFDTNVKAKAVGWLVRTILATRPLRNRS
ncbi:MAG TPA: hypothetical protein VIP11_24780 [Gemmatimonadaceae bacterium]